MGIRTGGGVITPLSRGAFAYPYGIWEEGKVIDNEAVLMEGYEEDAVIKRKVENGTMITILEEKKNSRGEMWYEVLTWESERGWLNSENVEKL